MNRRGFLRLAGAMITGTMIQPQVSINWFYKPPTRPAPKMPTRYVLTDRWGKQLAEGCFDNFICGQYSDGVTRWTEFSDGPSFYFDDKRTSAEEIDFFLSAGEIVFCRF